MKDNALESGSGFGPMLGERFSAPRSEGVLATAQAQALRDQGVPLAFDPKQIGWVVAAVDDDLAQTPHHALPKQAPVSFRAWRASDAGIHNALLNDPQVWAHMPEPYPNPLTPDASRALIDLSNEGSHHKVRAILYEGQVVGQVRLEFDPNDHSRAEISYWLGRAHWGRGLARRAVGAYSDQAQQRGIRTLTARVRPANVASLNLLEKIGFDRVGEKDGWTLFERTA